MGKEGRVKSGCVSGGKNALKGLQGARQDPRLREFKSRREETPVLLERLPWRSGERFTIVP